MGREGLVVEGVCLVEVSLVGFEVGLEGWLRRGERVGGGRRALSWVNRKSQMICRL